MTLVADSEPTAEQNDHCQHSSSSLSPSTITATLLTCFKILTPHNTRTIVKEVKTDTLAPHWLLNVMFANSFVSLCSIVRTTYCCLYSCKRCPFGLKIAWRLNAIFQFDLRYSGHYVLHYKSSLTWPVKKC